MQSQMAAMGAELQASKDKAEELGSINAMLSAQLATAQRELSAAQVDALAATDKARCACVDLGSQVESLNATLEAERQQLRASAEEQARLRVELESAKRAYVESEGQHSHAVNELKKALDDKSQELRTALSAAEKMDQGLKEGHTMVQGQEQRHAAEMESARAKLEGEQAAAAQIKLASQEQQRQLKTAEQQLAANLEAAEKRSAQHAHELSEMKTLLGEQSRARMAAVAEVEQMSKALRELQQTTNINEQRLQQELASAQAKLTASKAMVNKANTSQHEQRTIAAGLEHQLRVATAKVNDLQTQVAQQSAQLQIATASEEETKLALGQALEEQLKMVGALQQGLEETRQSLEQERRSAKEQRAHLSEEMEALQGTLDSVVKQSHDKDKTIAQLQASAASQQASLAQTQQALSQAQSDLKSTKDALNKLQGALQAASAEKAAALSTITTLKKDMSTLQEELKIEQTRRSKLQSECEGARQSNDDLQLELQAAREQCRLAQEDLARMQQLVSKSEGAEAWRCKEIETLQERISGMQAKTAAREAEYRSACVEAVEQRRGLQSDLSEERRRCAAAASKLAEMENAQRLEVEVVKAELARERDDCARFRSQADQWEVDRSALQAEIARLSSAAQQAAQSQCIQPCPTSTETSEQASISTADTATAATIRPTAEKMAQPVLQGRMARLGWLLRVSEPAVALLASNALSALVQ